MRTRTTFRTVLLLVTAAGLSSAHALTQEELVTRIQAAGYSQVSDIKSTAEGTTAKAVKDGKGGAARRRQQRPDQGAKVRRRLLRTPN
ncbi:hypothetical protein ACVWXO_010076 [Bradyrhizobium sp. LM2.7]